MSILIIEDDPAIRAVLTEILQEEGYQITGVLNGLEALTCLRRLAVLPRLILFDLSMPVMDGWAFRAEQLQDVLLAAIPAIVMSALPDLVYKSGVLNVKGCLSKPIDITLLLSMVARHYLTPALEM